jgi:uncharacterized protein
MVFMETRHAATFYTSGLMADKVRFDWDQSNIDHIARHGVAPQEVEQVFVNEPNDDGYEVVDGEPRWTIIGHTSQFRVLLVVWTVRGGAVRPITAREVNKRVRECYFKAKGF